MAREDPITRALAVTDQSLRQFFPADFHKRCMYGAFGLASLLEDAGVAAQVIGGDFLCAVVSDDGQQMSLQGFGTLGAGEPSHFWVHAHGLLIDLGPMYLPYESSFSAPSPPMITWPLSSPLPDFIAYRERLRASHDAELADPTLDQRRADFVAHCRAANRAHIGRALPRAWQLRDYQSLNYVAQKGDPWAVSAIEFLRRAFKAELPSA